MGIEAEKKVGSEEEIDLEQIAADEVDNKKEVPKEEVQLSEVEQKAHDQGWRPEDEFEGPEGNWKTARDYVRDGEFIATIKGLNQKIDNQKVDFDQRLENSNKLHEARRKKEISDLKSIQREAVSVSDTDAFDNAQKEIDELEKVPAETKTTVSDDPIITAWEIKNPWITDVNDERRPVAQAIRDQFFIKHPTASTSQMLTHVDDRIGKLYPVNNDNPRRNQKTVNETGTKRGKKGGKELTMSDLTQDEKSDWNQFGQSMFKDEAEFLKAVKDTRAS